MRDDLVQAFPHPEVLVEQAPAHEDGYIRVRAVLEHE
jgi:Asp-tRNA(Asn)/Glu-tRNA(Gln) amidotransferase C subunit